MKKIINVSIIILGLSCILWNNSAKAAHNDFNKEVEKIAALRSWWDDIFGYSPEKQAQAKAIIDNLEPGENKLIDESLKIRLNYLNHNTNVANPAAPTLASTQNQLSSIINQRNQLAAAYSAAQEHYYIIIGKRDSNAKIAAGITAAAIAGLVAAKMGYYIMPDTKEKENTKDAS